MSKALNTFEHCLLRPDLYIGSVKTKEDCVWTFECQDGIERITRKNISINPGLHRIFIEILSNAIDNKWRSENENVSMTKIWVETNSETGEISILNDGKPIPVKKQTFEFKDEITQKVSTQEFYLTELLFGCPRTSTNYDDTENRKTSGRNGIGAKATNIWSKTFTVEHVDDNGMCYKQTWKDNATQRGDPKITKTKKKPYTKITFIPDYERFGYKNLDEAMMGCIHKHAHDTAMITGVQVKLNKTLLKTQEFLKYIKLYFPNSRIKIFQNEESICGIADGADMFGQVSFVNGIFTSQGGVHVDEWSDAIFKRGIVSAYNAKTKKRSGVEIKLTTEMVQRFFTLFVVSELTNPAFDSQEKTRLNAPRPKRAKIEKEDIEKILKWPFVKMIEDEQVSKKEQKAHKTTKKPITMGVKAKDANKAGTSQSHKCTLLITEGLSAKSLAESGIASLKLHDFFGALAIKGKFINARKKGTIKSNENEEVGLLKRILGLEKNVDYSRDDAWKTLRYGKVLFFTDADVDGIHIRGLLLSFFHTEYPSLFYRKGFLGSMSVPIVRVKKGREILDFYSISEYRLSVRENGSLNAKYYKGLGTYNHSEAKTIFGSPKWVFYEESDQTERYMNIAFDEKVKDRKEWIVDVLKKRASNDLDANYIYEGKISHMLFVENQLIEFIEEDLKRSIPNMFDGLKESQRKILFAMLKRGNTSAKVEQLAGYISQTANYHHGETSLCEAITKMAQGFVGSNNIPFLENEGQFGSRMYGGKDAASPRYIYTKLEKLTRKIFRQEDDCLLKHTEEEGQIGEPHFYLPILPVVLINGCSGIATGCSSSIPCFCPVDICEEIRRFLKGKPIRPIRPWYRNFKGEIKEDNGNYITSGIVKETEKTVDVLELPIGLWTGNYKEKLEELQKNKKIKQFEECHESVNDVHFKIYKNSNTDKAELDLKTKITLSNMVLLTKGTFFEKFENIESIIGRFCEERLPYYSLRREKILESLNATLNKKRWILKFIKKVLKGSLSLFQEEAELVQTLIHKGYPKIEESHDYLLNIKTRHMTKTHVTALENDIQDIMKKIDFYSQKTPEDMWEEDIEEFLKEWNGFKREG